MPSLGASVVPRRRAALAAALHGIRSMDDRGIERELRARLASPYMVEPGAVEMEVDGGVVTLRGTVEQWPLKRMVEFIARCVDGVVEVLNRIEVSLPFGLEARSGPD
jgi:osmotically-inducible protein OsmY